MPTFEGFKLEPNEVLFLDPETDDAWHIPLASTGVMPGGINVSHLTTYPAKQVMGDWLRSNHEVLSSFTQSDFTGGGQKFVSDEATDQARFWRGTLGTRHPHQLSLGLESRSISGATSEVAIPLADYGDATYAALGKRFGTVGESGFVQKGVLAQVPVAKPAVPFTGNTNVSRLFIPMGSHGYQVWDGTSLSVLQTGVKPIEFLEWDNKLYALQSDGTLMESLDGLTDWQQKVKLPPESRPRGMVVFYNRQDEPTIHIVSQRAVYAVDLSIGKLYRSELDPPPHPDAGLACSKWRTDLYVSYGIGVHQYTGNSIIAMGLDRDSGVPRDLDGRITSMAEGYNGLYALVQGRAEAANEYKQTYTTELGWDDMYLSQTKTRSTLQMWDSFGWHTVWESSESDLTPTSVIICTSTGRERLWWGVGNKLYYQDVHHMYYNPEQRDLTATYEKTGSLETAIYDFAMTGQVKTAYAIELMTKGCTETETITVEYKIDEQGWVPLPAITKDGPAHLTKFYLGGKGTFPDNTTPRYDGLPFIDMQIRIRMERGDDKSKTPLLESYCVVFHKIMGPLKAYQLALATGRQDFREYKGHSAAEITKFVDRMVNSAYLVPMLYGNRWRNVRFAGSSGMDADGVDQNGDRTISVLEVLD